MIISFTIPQNFRAREDTIDMVKTPVGDFQK
jgi:hypothetical protein